MEIWLYFLSLAIAPTLFVVWYVYSLDRWEPEPKSLVMKVFFAGILSIIPAFLIEWGGMAFIATAEPHPSLWTTALVAFIIVAVTEEACKYLPFKIMIGSHEEFDEKIDGVVYMVAAAMGFAAIENIGYVLIFGAQFSVLKATQVGLARAVLSTPAHAICSGILGVHLGKAEFTSSDFSAFFTIAKGFFLAVLIHGFYDFFIFINFPWASVPVLVLGGLYFMKQIHILQEDSPYKPEIKEELVVQQKKEEPEQQEKKGEGKQEQEKAQEEERGKEEKKEVVAKTEKEISQVSQDAKAEVKEEKKE
ncbi:MAG: protease PrsW [Planctomycetota bacterium]|nr:MAG: protease PrsW [Planctomycetota bacterium]